MTQLKDAVQVGILQMYGELSVLCRVTNGG